MEDKGVGLYGASTEASVQLALLCYRAVMQMIEAQRHSAITWLDLARRGARTHPQRWCPFFR